MNSFCWKTDVFTLSEDSLHFEQTHTNRVPVQSVEIRNNTSRTLHINKLLGQSGLFSINEELPVSLKAGESRILLVSFDTDTAGWYEDILTFCYDSGSSRISVQLPVSAESRVNTYLPDNAAPSLTVFPNPFSSTINIRTNHPLQQLQILDLHGRLVHQERNPGNSTIINLESLDAGIYILRSINADLSLTRFRIIKI